MRRNFVVLTLLCFFLTGNLFATSTAFWRPYTANVSGGNKPSPFVYLLLHFNNPNFSDYLGASKITSVINPDSGVQWSPNGKFGGCAKFDGYSVLRYSPSVDFSYTPKNISVWSHSYISIEAWIKVKKYPKNKGYIVYRRVEKGATKGFSLYIDSNGGFHLSVTNLDGTTTTYSSPGNIIPLNKWVHIAGISISGGFSRLYLNGHLVKKQPTGPGLYVWGKKETRPGGIYIGNNKKFNGGFIGKIDEVRIDKNVFKFWKRQDKAQWIESTNNRKIPTGPPYFLASHQPVLYFPFDGSLEPEINKFGKITVVSSKYSFVNGVRGKAFKGSLNNGQLTITGNQHGKTLFNLNEGSIEFWFKPVNWNDLSDFNIGICSIWPGFNFYIYNCGVYNGSLQPPSLYFYFPPKLGGGLFMIRGNGEIYEGKWWQVVITWKNKDIRIYLDGKLIAKKYKYSLAQTSQNSNQLSFSRTSAIDEVYIYKKALTPEEVQNAYYRYRDPAKLKPVQFHPVSLLAQYFPSDNLIYYKMVANEQKSKISQLQFHFILRDEKGKELFRKQVNFSKEEQAMKIPYLKGTSGYKYILDLYATEPDGKEINSGVFKFERRHFAWENNTLGKTDTVYSPYTSVKAQGRNVSVVLRKYQMNGFGLWDKVISKGKNILAGPIVIKWTTKNGEGKWERISTPELIKTKPTYAIYSSSATAQPIQIRTISKVEFDGTMKVKMHISPGSLPQKIDRIYIDIPIKEKYAPLFHEVVDGPRINYAGWLPQINQKIIHLPGSMLGLTKAPKLSIQQDQGIVWNSTQAQRSGKWLDSFVSYIWLGGEERGIAFFGDNDKGWYTIKDGNKTPIQEIIRQGNAVVLRIYLADHPVILKHSTSLVFGLDVSPTKPMPKNWRIKLQYIPRGLPVNAWGGLDCSYGTPYKNHWKIVDKIEEARNQKKVPENITQWFEAFAKKYNPPPVYGTWNWLQSVEWFAQDAANAGPHKPITCYTEEMDVNGVRKEWRTYLYEWTSNEYFYNQYKRWPNYSIYTHGANAGGGVGITWNKSERDYAVWLKNQWLKRGVGLYWDNFYLHLSYNFRTTPAYITKTGQIQPCVTIWEVRKYIRRVWNLLAYWRQQYYKKTGKPFNPQDPWQGTPLEFVLHMTNTLILPWDTFATADLDNELGPPIPMQPNRDRTETLGLQAGNYPLTLYPLFGRTNPDVPKDGKIRSKINWGMEMVHEIKRAPLWYSEIAKLDKLVFGYGYGTKNIKVYHYWSRKPVLKVNNNKIKWIVLSKPGDKSMLIILSSYSKNQVSTPLRIHYNVLGITVNKAINVTNVLTGKAMSVHNIILKAPYGVDILKVQY